MVTERTKEPTAWTAKQDDYRPGSERHGGSAAQRQRSEIRNINEVLAEHRTLGTRISLPGTWVPGTLFCSRHRCCCYG
jgi:hypothetical protein